MATYFSFWAILLGGLGIAGAYYQLLSPLFGLYTVLAGLGILLLSLLLGLVQWLRYGRKEAPWLALVSGFVAVGAVAYATFRALASPVSDVSTDTKNPPAFLAPLYTVNASGPDGKPDPAFLWPRQYDPGSAAKQLKAFPNLQPLLVQAAPERVYPAVVQALKGLPPPWRVTFEDPSQFHVELVRENELFHFVDDLVVELRALKARPESTSVSTAVEIRSRARWALRGGPVLGDFTTDFGTGARRLRYVRGLLEAATKAVEAGEGKARAAALGSPAAPGAAAIPAASPNPAAAVKGASPAQPIAVPKAPPAVQPAPRPAPPAPKSNFPVPPKTPVPAKQTPAR